MKKKDINEIFKHWGYGYGKKANAYGQTTTSASGDTLTLEKLEQAIKEANKIPRVEHLLVPRRVVENLDTLWRKLPWYTKLKEILSD